MFNRFRKNPISDEISVDDKLEFYQPNIDKILRLAQKLKDQLLEEGITLEQLKPVVEKAYVEKLDKRLDDLEKKITRLAVDYAIEEAKKNYDVDISDEMYAQFPTARSNPFSRKNRQSSRFTRFRSNRY